jgi:hypothetical protein
MFTAVLVAVSSLAAHVSLRLTPKRAPAELPRKSRESPDPILTGQAAHVPASILNSQKKVKYALTWSAARISALPGDGIDSETLAAISDRLTGIFGRQVSIRSARKLPAPDLAVNQWARQGRAQVHDSHLVQRVRFP